MGLIRYSCSHISGSQEPIPHQIWTVDVFHHTPPIHGIQNAEMKEKFFVTSSLLYSTGFRNLIAWVQSLLDRCCDLRSHIPEQSWTWALLMHHVIILHHSLSWSAQCYRTQLCSSSYQHLNHSIDVGHVCKSDYFPSEETGDSIMTNVENTTYLTVAVHSSHTTNLGLKFLNFGFDFTFLERI